MLDYPAEIVSDLSRFHGVDDVGAMPSLRFFALVPLLVHYDGALLAAVKRLPVTKPAEAQMPAVPLTAQTMRSPAFAAAPGFPAVFSTGPVPPEMTDAGRRAG